MADLVKALSPEQAAWLKAFSGFTPPPAPDGSSAVATGATGAAPALSPSPTPVAAAKSPAPAKLAPAKPAPAKQAAPGKITYDSFNFLVLQLQTLASPANQTKPAPALMLTGEKIVADVLRTVEQVVAKWRDTKTLPDAVRLWRATEPQLYAFLADAQQHLDIAASQLGDARKAIDDIADFLSMRDVDQELDAAAAAKPTPELAFDLDAREQKKLEPGMLAWRDAIRASGNLAPAEAKKLEHLIDIYFSASDPAKRLAAFKAAHAVPDTGSLLDVTVLLSDNGAQAATGLAETFLDVAAKAHQAGEAGAEEALEALTKWKGRVKSFSRLGRGFFGVVNIALSAKTLADGISKGDWHKITAGVFGMAAGGVEVAEAAGVIGAEASMTIGMGIVVAWGTIDAILSAAELAHWFRQKQEQDAFLALVADARKLVPKGKYMAAAVDKMMDSQNDTDALGAANNQRYKEIAEKAGGELRAAVNKLIDHHVNSSNKNTVGGYPGLIQPALPVIQQGLTTMNLFKDVPTAVSEGFDIIVHGIQLMTLVEAASNDA